jgi:hypothetical protein
LHAWHNTSLLTARNALFAVIVYVVCCIIMFRVFLPNGLVGGIEDVSGCASCGEHLHAHQHYLHS